MKSPELLDVYKVLTPFGHNAEGAIFTYPHGMRDVIYLDNGEPDENGLHTVLAMTFNIDEEPEYLEFIQTLTREEFGEEYAR